VFKSVIENLLVKRMNAFRKRLSSKGFAQPRAHNFTEWRI